MAVVFNPGMEWHELHDNPALGGQGVVVRARGLTAHSQTLTPRLILILKYINYSQSLKIAGESSGLFDKPVQKGQQPVYFDNYD